jgi:hypothetical protein
MEELGHEKLTFSGSDAFRAQKNSIQMLWLLLETKPNQSDRRLHVTSTELLGKASGGHCIDVMYITEKVEHVEKELSNRKF